jgi:bacterioferritin-associated ferredoxin
MRNNSFNKASKPGQRPASSDPGKKSGFAGLDPSRLGLGTPDWLEAATAADSPPSPHGDRPSTPASPVLAQGPATGPAAEPRTLVEGMKVVCICKGIKKRTFWKVLDDGAQTKEEINRMTGSGSGSCQGRRCGPRILDLLRNHHRGE